MSGVLSGTQGTGVIITAKVFKACQCGHAFGFHQCIHCGCTGYAPTEPPVDYGTRAYVAPPGLPLLRLVCCRVAWALEFRLQGWRERLERKPVLEVSDGSEAL